MQTINALGADSGRILKLHLRQTLTTPGEPPDHPGPKSISGQITATNIRTTAASIVSLFIQKLDSHAAQMRHPQPRRACERNSMDLLPCNCIFSAWSSKIRLDACGPRRARARQRERIYKSTFGPTYGVRLLLEDAG